MSAARDLIGQLTSAWGDAAAIAALVAEDAEWWITPTASLPSPMVGKAEIEETMQRVFGEIYDPARTRAEVHMTLADGLRASTRITMISHVLLSDRPYRNEYAIFIETNPAGTKLSRIWEYLDVKHAMDQLGGDPGENQP